MKNALGTFLRENATAKRGRAPMVAEEQDHVADEIMALVKQKGRVEAVEMVSKLGLSLGLVLDTLDQLERFGLVTVDRSGAQPVIAVPG